jgi:imidazolonepropionase-like amidohydrolase
MTMFLQKGVSLLPGEPAPDPRPAIAARARHLQAQGVFTAIGGDFPAFGKAYGSLSEEEWSATHQIALSRLRALNWLCGFGADWDTVPLET